MTKAKTSTAPPAVPNLKRRKLLTIVGVLLSLLLVTYVGRGFVRKSLLPGIVERVAGDQVSDVFVSEANKLGNPLPSLGFTGAASLNRNCYMVVANGLSTQVECSRQLEANQTLKDMRADSRTLIAGASKLQQLLEVNGWKGDFAQSGQNALVSLITDLTKGIDYHPDATYIKEVDGATCTFSNYTAFAKPAEPALSSKLWCTKTYNILGTPSWD